MKNISLYEELFQILENFANKNGIIINSVEDIIMTDLNKIENNLDIKLVKNFHYKINGRYINNNLKDII